MKKFLINFWGFTRLRYFKKCTLIVIMLIAKISFIASYVLLRIRATGKFINRKICVAIYNTSTNIVIIPISVFKLTCLLNILTNLPMFSITSDTCRFFGLSVSKFCLYRIILKGASVTSTSHERLLPKNSLVFLIRCKKYMCLI